MWIRDPINVHMDPDPRGVKSKTKEITLKNNFKKLNFKSYKGILTFELPVQNLPNEPVHSFKAFYLLDPDLSMRIREDFLNVDPQHCWKHACLKEKRTLDL